MKSSHEILGGVTGGQLSAAEADVGRTREQNRQRRLLILTVSLGAVAAWLWVRVITGNPFTVA